MGFADLVDEVDGSGFVEFQNLQMRGFVNLKLLCRLHTLNNNYMRKKDKRDEDCGLAGILTISSKIATGTGPQFDNYGT